MNNALHNIRIRHAASPSTESRIGQPSAGAEDEVASECQGKGRPPHQDNGPSYAQHGADESDPAATEAQMDLLDGGDGGEIASERSGEDECRGAVLQAVVRLDLGLSVCWDARLLHLRSRRTAGIMACTWSEGVSGSR